MAASFIHKASIAVLAGFGGAVVGAGVVQRRASLAQAAVTREHQSQTYESVNRYHTRIDEHRKQIDACYVRFVQQLADPAAVQRFVKADTEQLAADDVVFIENAPGGDYYDGWYHCTDEFYAAEQRETARDMVRICKSDPTASDIEPRRTRWTWMQRNMYESDARRCEIEEAARADLAQAGLLRHDAKRERPGWANLRKPCTVNGQNVE